MPSDPPVGGVVLTKITLEYEYDCMAMKCYVLFYTWQRQAPLGNHTLNLENHTCWNRSSTRLPVYSSTRLLDLEN
jgi:hypothetical protein